MYQKGKTIRSPKMSLVFVENNRGFTRFAVVVSKKVEKSAVKRNRIRRKIYEVIRNNLNSIPKKTDYIFVVFDGGLLGMKNNEIAEIMRKLLMNAKVCYNK